MGNFNLVLSVVGIIDDRTDLINVSETHAE
jgi:hypothetical protein